MKNDNLNSNFASRIYEIEIIDENENTIDTYGPYNNAITDECLCDLTARDNLYYLNGGMTLSTGVWYPIKYRGPSTATVLSGIMVAPGLVSDYGVDVSGVGYVNAPTLTGKVVKFDSGHEYYISGVLGGNIILRSGGRIKTPYDYAAGGVFQSTYPSWFFPIADDISTPTNYTIWNLGDANYRDTRSDSMTLKYGANSITTTTFSSGSSAVVGSVTGVWGEYSGKYLVRRKYETATLSSDTKLGKISIRGNEGSSTSSRVPFAHANIGGNSGIQVLSGQKIRATYELIFDFNPMISGMNNISSGAFVDGWPTSSGYFIPYGYSKPQYGIDATQNTSLDIRSSYMPYSTIIGGASLCHVIPIFSGGGATFAFGNGMSFATAKNITGSLNILTTAGITSDTSVGGNPINCFFPITSGNTICSGGRLKRYGGFTVGINSWNTDYLLGFAFRNGPVSSPGGNLSMAFWFYEPQQKRPEYELTINMEAYGLQRVLIN